VPHVVLIDLPSPLGLRPSGVQDLPAALRRAGLAERLGATDAGRIDPPPYAAERDAATGLLNGPALAQTSRALAALVAGSLARGEFPVVLAGDCSVLLGALLGLRRHARDVGRRYGLLFLDGHVDFYQPEASPTGEVADMELALATGRGPALLADLDGLGPLMADADVVALGAARRRRASRGGEPGRARYGCARPRAGRRARAGCRRRGAGRGRGGDAPGSARRRRMLVHLDADVLDDAVMPAVDYRQPGGLTRRSSPPSSDAR
jgi:arginase